ncbi:MAG: hypothetical protein RSC66_03455, partial [Comamonas sp.]
MSSYNPPFEIHVHGQVVLTAQTSFEQLQEALLVNPYDVHGTAAVVQQALQMPLQERRQRHQR